MGNVLGRRAPAGRRGTAMAAVVALTALSGCWLQPGGGAGGTRHNDHETGLTTANVASLAEDWSVAGQQVASEPVVDAAGRVFTTWTDHLAAPAERRGVEARSTATGELLWRRLLAAGEGPGEDWIGPPSVVGDTVWVPYGLASQPCAYVVERFDPATGAVVGSGTVSGGSVATPVIGGDGVVAFGARPCDSTSSWELVVRHAETGGRLWSVELTGTPATPSVAGGRVFVVAAGRLHAFPASGCGAATCDPEWTYSPPAGAVYGRPAVTPGGHVVLSAYDRAGPPERPFARAMVRVVSGSTGTELWRTAIEEPDAESALQGVAVDGSTVFTVGTPAVFGPGRDRLAAYPLGGCGAPECPPAWTAPLGGVPGIAGPVVGGGVVYVDATDEVQAFPAAGCGAATCTALRRVPLPERASAFSLADGRLFASFWSSVPTLPRLAAYGP